VVKNIQKSMLRVLGLERGERTNRESSHRGEKEEKYQQRRSI